MHAKLDIYVFITITGSIPLLMDYQSPEVSSTQQSVLLSLGLYLCWWTISLRRYHLPSSQCYYHQVNTFAGGLLVSRCIIYPVASVTITRLIPLLVDYQSPEVSSTRQPVFRLNNVIITKTIVPLPREYVTIVRLLSILFMPLQCSYSIRCFFIWFSNPLNLSVHNGDYCRNAQCIKFDIYVFIIIMQGAILQYYME